MQLDSSIAAVVTGGASGLGAATARRLASHGVKVALFDLNAEQGEALAKELGGVFCKVDVTSEEQVDAAFAKARAAHGQERVLVNCAGTGNAVKTASRDKATGLLRYSVTMPLTGPYVQLRAFVEEALAGDGALSLDRMRLRRASTGANLVEADLTWSFYMRPGGAAASGVAR